jgi:hypothetical protein
MSTKPFIIERAARRGAGRPVCRAAQAAAGGMEREAEGKAERKAEGRKTDNKATEAELEMARTAALRRRSI